MEMLAGNIQHKGRMDWCMSGDPGALPGCEVETLMTPGHSTLRVCSARLG